MVIVQLPRHEDTKRSNMDFKPLSEKEEFIAKKIVDVAYTVHKKSNFNEPLIKNGIKKIIL